LYAIQTQKNIDTFNNYGIDFTSEFVNSDYNKRAIFYRSNKGYTPTTGEQIISSTNNLTSFNDYQFAVYDTTGIPVSSFIYSSVSGRLLPTVNCDYLREYVQDKYPEANLNIKSVITNVYNTSDTQTNEIVFNLSALDPGYHHFGVRFDSYHGYMSFFVNGQLINEVQFTPRKYKFSNLIYRPFLIGTSCYNNSIPLYQYLQKDRYLVENTKIKNFYLYDRPLNDYDIIMHGRKDRDIQDIHLNLPCGKRNYTEEIERYFKANIPGIKSTLFNVVIRNTGITDPNLKLALEQRIITTVNASAPIYSKLNTIKWIN
jgi:hypothetical protein